MKNRTKVIIAVAIVLPIIYLFAAYTSLDPIAKYRDLYIETAMSTMTHQYLAKIFPQSVIDKAMANTEKQFDENKVERTLPLGQSPFADALRLHQKPQGANAEKTDPWTELQELFPEINIETLRPHVTDEDLKTLDIENPDYKVKTIHGDDIYAINVPESILIINIKTSTYNGMLAISKHPESTILGTSKNPNRGQTITEMCGSYNAILGINASGFYDPGGHGDGKTPVGLVLSQGELSGTRMYDRYQIAGMDLSNNFIAGYDPDLTQMRDAVQFYPIIISENQKQAWGTFGMGIQPRTCIGQNIRGDMMFLIIDGRQVGHSVGITVQECADIMLKYDCYIAMNMDGGSSASMTYKDKMITRTSSPMSTGRYLPDAWLVLKQTQESEEPQT